MTMEENCEEDPLPEHDSCKDFYAKYEVKEVLGKGVSSTVRRCVEKETNVDYAVKIIDMTGEKDNEFQLEEFQLATKRETNILRMCAEHPRIIELHDTFETPTFLFLVMEICKKGELFDYLTEVVTMSEKRTRQVMRQLLEAVIFIHDKDIVHRDLKPENILLDDNINVKLSDFGFAVVVSNDQEITDLCGTPGYLAPEVLKVSMYDGAPGYGKPVDMWAYGVIMYTLLVGCPPFWHRKQMYMLRSIMEGKYSFTSPEWDDIGEHPKDLIAKLLVIDPAERLTAHQAMEHAFFKREEREEKKKFYPKRTFKAAAFLIIALHRIRQLHLNPQPVHVDQLRREPYGAKALRKLIDAASFRLYGHWVKRGENQNRAALFENVAKRDLKMSESSTDLTQNVMERTVGVEVKGRINRQVHLPWILEKKS